MRPNQPSCVQDVKVAVTVGVGVLIRVLPGGSSPSKQPPNQPGYLHDDVDVGEEEVVVIVGAGLGEVVCEVSVDAFLVVVVDSSRQPNQPGVLQVDVDDVEVDVVDVFLLVVVDSSRQPNQPGVLHVSVLVRVLLLVEVDVGLLVLVVVVSVPLLSKYFHV